MDKRLKKDILILVFFIISLTIKFTEGYSFVTPFIQLLLSKHFLLESYHLRKYNKDVKNIQDDFCKIYSKNNTLKVLAPEIILNLIKYESMLSSYKITLSNSVFKENNPRLTKEWNVLKVKYNLNNI